MFLKSVIALFQFCTVIPLGKPVEFEEFARRSWLYPLAGYVTGGFAALVSFFIPDRAVSAAFAIAGLFLITGCNHLDGLLDFGDGLMAHGDREKRIRALTDRQIGTGAVAMGVSVVLITWAGLQAASPVIWALIAGEVCAKFSMSFLTVTGKPFRDGIHSYLHTMSKHRFIIYSAVLCVPLAFLPVSPAKLVFAAITMVAVPMILLGIANRLFGGVNGDIVGASSEITRAMVIVVFALL
ncbi:MAG TPA: adenosylcobinamide-GDP ribazoletransferase [Methanoregulaceae archaeon]|nr:adenosylcobinamide-GDP ribazoletransferase [Methanoregulaceae archaeon]